MPKILGCTFIFGSPFIPFYLLTYVTRCRIFSHLFVSFWFGENDIKSKKNSFKIVESRIFCVNFYQNCRFSLLFRYLDMIIVHISSSHSLGDSKETTSFKTLSISERWIRMIHHLYRECIANPHNVLFFSLVDCTITVIAFIFFSFCVPIYRVFLVNSLLFVSVSISLFWLLLI